MEIVTAAGSKLGEYLVEATVNQARYLFCFNSIVGDLEDDENNLKLALDRIKKAVEREENNTKEIEKDVEKWLNDVDNVMADVQRLKAEIQVKQNCLNGWCPNWGWRYWLSRKATKKRNSILKLQQNSGKFSTVAHLKPLPGIEFSAPSDFIPFQATELAFDQLTEALKNEKTKIVGLYGPGGIGKTTLAKVVGNKLRQQLVFDEVVIAIVSQNPNMINIQNQLAESLGFKLEEVTKEERAKRLFLRFTETKSKILVILDDVWKQYNLKNELGIPVDDNHNGCKILITTRRKHVVSSGCDSPIPLISLGILKPEEGLALLKHYASIGDDDSTLTDVSKEVADECKGLPLAIAAVGSALRGKEVNEWKLVSQKLKNAELIDVDDVDVDVYACLKLSYDYLKGEDTKLCFLLCSLFPEDFKIDLEDLVRYGVGLGWYQSVETIEKARSLMHGMIKGLKASSLLLDTGEEGFVKMHDIVRDVALWIGSKEKRFFSRAGIGLMEWPEDNDMEQYMAISLVENKIKVLPNDLVCPNLHILLLGNEYAFHRYMVPDQFFEGMKELKVATIIGGTLSVKSLQFSTNLQVLQLIRCDVRDVSFLGKLKRLQILCLKGSSFDEFPDDLADKLSKLKLLDFPFLSISPIVIKRFSQLQEFYGLIKTWKVEGTSSDTSYGRLAELDSESGTGTFHENVESLSKDFTFPKLQRYDIRMGSFIELDYSRSQTKALSIGKIEATSLVIFWALYQNLQHLSLDEVIGCRNILPSIDQRGLNELTSLILNDCEDLECIMDASQHVKSRNLVMLSSLAMLRLRNLRKLQWIWKAPAQHVSLQNLAKVEVIECNNLTYLFSLAQARSLVQLKSLQVRECERLEHIIEANLDDNEGRTNILGGDENTIALPMLRKLALENLPNFTSFCSECYYSTWQALQELNLRGCRRLTVIAELEASVQNLAESSNLYHLQEVEISYKGPTDVFSLQNLTTLSVSWCIRLRHLLSPTLARNLLQLEKLYIHRCFLLEQIIDDEEHQYHLQPVCFPKLKTLEIRMCPKLKRLFHISIAPSLQKLEELFIDEIFELEQVFWHKDGADVMDDKKIVMTKLSRLELADLPNLTNFWPVGYQFTFPLLCFETVVNCPKLEELQTIRVGDVSKEEDGSEERDSEEDASE